MSFDLSIALSSEARERIEEIAGGAARALPAMARALDKQNDLTIGYAQLNRLTGPRPDVLGVVTNRLRSSLRRTDATVTGDEIAGAIGSNVVYAGVHEYGFDGDVQVSAHVRRNRNRNVFSAKGKLRAQGVSFVKSFTRHMHMPERSFIRFSIDARRLQYDSALSAAVLDALGGAT